MKPLFWASAAKTDAQAGNVSLAIAQTMAAMSALPPEAIMAFEIGNEPNAYIKRGARANGYAHAVHEENEFTRTSEELWPRGRVCLVNAGHRSPILGDLSILQWWPASLKYVGCNWPLFAAHDGTIGV
jgi:hypothetical protein